MPSARLIPVVVPATEHSVLCTLFFPLPAQTATGPLGCFLDVAEFRARFATGFATTQIEGQFCARFCAKRRFCPARGKENECHVLPNFGNRKRTLFLPSPPQSLTRPSETVLEPRPYLDMTFATPAPTIMKISTLRPQAASKLAEIRRALGKTAILRRIIEGLAGPRGRIARPPRALATVSRSVACGRSRWVRMRCSRVAAVARGRRRFQRGFRARRVRLYRGHESVALPRPFRFPALLQSLDGGRERQKSKYPMGTLIGAGGPKKDFLDLPPCPGRGRCGAAPWHRFPLCGNDLRRRAGHRLGSRIRCRKLHG